MVLNGDTLGPVPSAVPVPGLLAPHRPLTDLGLMEQPRPAKTISMLLGGVGVRRVLASFLPVLLAQSQGPLNRAGRP